MFRLFRPSSIPKLHLRRRYGDSTPVSPCDPGVNVTILPNGTRIASEYKQTPLSCMSLLVEAGPRFETPCNNGITHVLEHMAYKGYTGMGRYDFETSLLLMGAKMTANTTREKQTFTGTFTSECYPRMVDFLTAIACHLELNYAELEQEKYNIGLEMIDEENNPRAVVFDYLHQTAFQGTPLAQRVIGSSYNVQRFNRDSLRSYYCQQYHPFKFIFSTAGAVPHDSVVSLIFSRLGHICGCPSSENENGPTRFTPSQIVYRDDSMPFAHVAIAFEAPGYDHDDYWKCLVASKMIGNWYKSSGGGFNNASHSARAASVDDLAERFESFYIPYRDVGLWGIYFVTRRLDVEDMLLNIQHQWMQLCLTTRVPDVQRGVNIAKMQLARDVTGVVNSCDDICTQLFYRCTRLPLEEKLKNVSLSVTQVVDCIERLIYNRHPAVAAVGPTECLPDYVRICSEMYWARL